MATYDNTKPNTSQTIGDVVRSTKSNLDALNDSDVAHAGNVSTAHGIDVLIAAKAVAEAHASELNTAHGVGTIRDNLATATAEITSARGTKGSLNERLSVGMQTDGAIKLSSIANKWATNNDVPTYIDTTHIQVPGNRTALYIGGMHVRMNTAAGYMYSVIASSSYGGVNTVITLDGAYATANASISSLDFALIAWDNAVANSCTTNATNISNVQGQVTSLKVERIDGQVVGKPAVSSTIKRFIAGRAFSIPSGVSGAVAKSAVAATANTVFTLAKNGTSFGTMTFAVSGTVPTWAAATATSFVSGDVLTLTAPASQDATLADFAFYIPGVLP